MTRTSDNDETTTTAAAMALLRETSYFAHAPEALLQELAGQLDRKTFAKGEILVYEGDVMDHIIIVESGRLLRTKLAVTDLRLMDETDRMTLVKTLLSHDELLAKSIVIDTLESRGRVSGLLHAFDQNDTTSYSSNNKAFATISAEDNDAVVYLLPKASLRQVLRQDQHHDCLFLLDALSREIRSGSKSLRGLILQQSQQQHKAEETRVRVLCYDTANWVSEGFGTALEKFNTTQRHQPDVWPPIHVDYTTDRLSVRSATYAAGYDAVCIFVNDDANANVLKTLSRLGVRMIALRCAGFDRVDANAATAYQLTVARVPAYSPYAVAEMAMTLLMSLNRKIVMASSRVHMTNFTIDSSLMGMDIHGKTVGVLGTGKIGGILCDILLGYGVQTLYCYDVYERDDLKAKGCIYKSDPSELYPHCDVIFVMLPLLESTYHAINQTALEQMKDGVIIINTSRGGLVDTSALLAALHSGKVGGVGMDVYENEQAYFFQDWSARHVADGSLLSLIGHPNVLLTAHQAFFTREAVGNIIDSTLQNIADCFWHGKTGRAHPNNCLPERK